MYLLLLLHDVVDANHFFAQNDKLLNFFLEAKSGSIDLFRNEIGQDLLSKILDKGVNVFRKRCFSELQRSASTASSPARQSLMNTEHALLLFSL